MPIYEYRCDNGHTFEVFQSMSEDPVSTCVECGGAAQRVLRAPAVHFKGSGFYTTDYARRSAQKAADDGGAKAGEKKESASSKAEPSKSDSSSKSGSDD